MDGGKGYTAEADRVGLGREVKTDLGLGRTEVGKGQKTKCFCCCNSQLELACFLYKHVHNGGMCRARIFKFDLPVLPKIRSLARAHMCVK